MGKMVEAAKKNLKNIILLFTFFIIINSSLSAANPSVISVVMNPPNPGFGDVFTVTMTYCADLNNTTYFDLAVDTNPTFQDARISGLGQVFLVYGPNGTSEASNIVDVPISRPAASPGGPMGAWGNAGPGGGSGSGDCDACASGAGSGKRFTKTYVLHMPQADMFPGCLNKTFYLHLGMRNSNINEGDWLSIAACSQYTSTSWTPPSPPADFKISKSSVGTLQLANDLIAYTIDYSYSGGPLTITDAIPVPPTGQFTLESVGPSGIWTGPAIGSTGGGTLTWTLPARPLSDGVATGTVWFLLRMNSAINNGTRINNTATGKMGAVTKNTPTLTYIVGNAAVNITKDESTAVPFYGDNITYYISYEVNGDQLVSFQPFDNYPNGVTYTASPPPGWAFAPSASNGNWYVHDACNTYDNIITGSSPTGDYPGLMNTTMGTFCTGTISTDVMIEASYEGADALVIIRNNNKNGTAQSIAYGLVVSVDQNAGGGTAATGNTGAIAFQRCYGQPATCNWTAGVAPPSKIETNKWYSVKIEATGPYTFRAKIWPKGDPEPSGWLASWTDPSPPTNDNADCTTGTWYPGVAQQGGASGWVRDNYNNFNVTKPRVMADVVVYDTVPTCLISPGTNAAGAGFTGGQFTWSTTSLSNQGGTLTWWGRVNCCDRITNTATIKGTGTQGVSFLDSSPVYADPICPKNTSITKTASPVNVYLNDLITFTINYQNNGSYPIYSYQIWDTIPNCIAVNTINNGGSTAGHPGIIVWNIGTLAANATGTVTWVGHATCYPSNPFNTYKEFFAYIKDYYRSGKF